MLPVSASFILRHPGAALDWMSWIGHRYTFPRRRTANTHTFCDARADRDADAIGHADAHAYQDHHADGNVFADGNALADANTHLYTFPL